MRIGFFGGSFDPPHRGHLAVAKAAREAFALDRVLLTPVAAQPLKKRGGFAAWTDRLNMAELACRNLDGLAAADLDAPRPDGRPNFTVDTLTRLREQEPNATIFGLTGLDTFAGLRQWRESDELLRQAQWIVVSRPGCSFEVIGTLGLSPEQLAQVHQLDSVAVPISATEIRARLQAGQSCAGLVPETVLAYIDEHRLYRGLK